MFRKVVVAFNESEEAKRALQSAIQIAESLASELHVVTVMARLPAFTSYAAAADPAALIVLDGDRVAFYRKVQAEAVEVARSHGIEVRCHLVDGHTVESIIALLKEQDADLLVLGLHPSDLFVARLWSTVYGLAIEAPCNVLGVH